ncbi:MAG TPA: hypothetical protein VLL97_06855 [Acidobacteriota bacterium]|nr:hypothetical protein [Acidobacteriota bacterium]
MTAFDYEELQKKISAGLNTRLREFRKIITDTSDLFSALGMETSVWIPEKIYTKNIGGIIAESHIGYAKIEGKWGLAIRTVERDQASSMFIRNRVYSIESCENIEMAVNGLSRTEELLLAINAVADNQIAMLKSVSTAEDMPGKIKKQKKAST